MGCLDCDCAHPDTPIATPDGDRRIAELAVGDLVYSVHGEQIVAVPIRRVNMTAVSDHEVIRVTLAGGVVLEISDGHPTADGRTFGDLETGGELDGAPITGVERVGYPLRFTHDILPDSDTGAYFAGGVLIGSTLAGETP